MSRKNSTNLYIVEKKIDLLTPLAENEDLQTMVPFQELQEWYCSTMLTIL
jgi:hypothetical protein